MNTKQIIATLTLLSVSILANPARPQGNSNAGHSPNSQGSHIRRRCSGGWDGGCGGWGGGCGGWGGGCCFPAIISDNCCADSSNHFCQNDFDRCTNAAVFSDNVCAHTCEADNCNFVNSNNFAVL